MEDIKSKIVKEIEEGKEEEIKFLQKLVQTSSVNHFISDPLKSSPYEPIEKEVAELIFAKLTEINLSPQKVGISENRPNIVAEFGKGKKTLIFNGHMDTVIPSSEYTFSPTSGVIKNGNLYGVGSLDMKSSLAAYIYAVKALLKFRNELSGKICLQFVIDEEPIAASYFGTSYLLRHGFKGDAAIVGEPGAHKITIGNKGGYRFKIETFGESVHTGSREWEQKKEGNNAILTMIKAIQALSDFKFPEGEHPVFPGRKSVLTFPTEINGGKAINMVPDRCVAFGDSRILPGIDKKFMENQIKDRLEALDIDYKLTSIVYVPAAVVDEKEEIVQLLQKNAKLILNKELIAEGSGPWSDMWMFIKEGIPTVNFGCQGEGMHGKDEYVEIESVLEVTKIYALTAFDFLKK